MNTSTLSLTIQLPKFEGPLALLLYLIRKDEMDIFDIEIHRITAQYLDFIRMMKELDLEVAGEFVAMASTLIQIKSRMLLPQYDEQGEVVEGADPRKELVQRLLEYQKYQEASKNLYERPLMGRDFWGRGTREKFEERIQEEIELEENALFSLISAYRRSYRAAMKRVHKVTAKAQSIASRILEMKSRLLVGTRVGMSEFVVGAEDKRRQILITFLATLELAKMGFVRLFQSDVYQEIHIETVAEIEDASLSKVEEYESLHTEEGEGLASLAPLTYDSVGDEPETAKAESAQLEFELKDSPEDGELAAEPLFKEDEMASDDEIFAAEQEMAGVASEPSSDQASFESFDTVEVSSESELAAPELTDAILGDAEVAEILIAAQAAMGDTSAEIEEHVLPLTLSDEPEVTQDLLFSNIPDLEVTEMELSTIESTATEVSEIEAVTELEFALPEAELEPTVAEENAVEAEAQILVSDDSVTTTPAPVDERLHATAETAAPAAEETLAAADEAAPTEIARTEDEVKDGEI